MRRGHRLLPPRKRAVRLTKRKGSIHPFQEVSRAAVNDHGAELTQLTCKPDAYILEGFHSNYVDVHSSASPYTVRVTFGGAPFLGLWAKPGADYVCIEPWEGLDDAHRQSGDLTEKKGIVALPAGDTHTFAITISVR